MNPQVYKMAFCRSKSRCSPCRISDMLDKTTQEFCKFLYQKDQYLVYALDCYTEENPFFMTYYMHSKAKLTSDKQTTSYFRHFCATFQRSSYKDLIRINDVFFPVTPGHWTSIALKVCQKNWRFNTVHQTHSQSLTLPRPFPNYRSMDMFVLNPMYENVTQDTSSEVIPYMDKAQETTPVHSPRPPMPWYNLRSRPRSPTPVVDHHMIDDKNENNPGCSKATTTKQDILAEALNIADVHIPLFRPWESPRRFSEAEMLGQTWAHDPSLEEAINPNANIVGQTHTQNPIDGNMHAEQITFTTAIHDQDIYATSDLSSEVILQQTTYINSEQVQAYIPPNDMPDWNSQDRALTSHFYATNIHNFKYEPAQDSHESTTISNESSNLRSSQSSSHSSHSTSPSSNWSTPGSASQSTGRHTPNPQSLNNESYLNTASHQVGGPLLTNVSETQWNAQSLQNSEDANHAFPTYAENTTSSLSFASYFAQSSLSMSIFATPIHNESPNHLSALHLHDMSSGDINTPSYPYTPADVSLPLTPYIPICQTPQHPLASDVNLESSQTTPYTYETHAHLQESI